MSSENVRYTYGTQKGGEFVSDKKMGRPVIGNPKNIDIKVRIDEETNKQLLKFCDEHGITRAESIRQAILSMLKK